MTLATIPQGGKSKAKSFLSLSWLFSFVCMRLCHSFLESISVFTPICVSLYVPLTSPPNIYLAAAAAKSLQSCPTLCDPIDSSPPGFAIPGIVQARTLEWFAISFSNAWKWKGKVKSLIYLECILNCFIHVQLPATLWTVACQALLSMEFSSWEYWSGLPFSLPGNLPHAGIKSASLRSPALAGRFFTTSASKPHQVHSIYKSFLKTTKFHDNFETLFKQNVLSYILTKSIAQNLNLVNDTFEGISNSSQILATFFL